MAKNLPASWATALSACSPCSVAVVCVWTAHLGVPLSVTGPATLVAVISALTGLVKARAAASGQGNP